MQIDQLHRLLKSDPDNVELARQLWNALLREQIPAELADIDVTDPSPKNWKAILRLVNVSEQSFRPLLLDVLKPLLRLWPIGSRICPSLPKREGALSKHRTFQSGAWQLFESTDQCLNLVNAYKDFDILGEAEASSVPGLGEFNFSDQFASAKTIRTYHNQLIHRLLTDTSNNCQELRQNICSLHVADQTQRQTQTLVDQHDLRSGLEALTIDNCESLAPVLSNHWPDLNQLTINFRGPVQFRSHSSSDLRMAFPKVTSVKAKIDVRLLQSDTKSIPANTNTTGNHPLASVLSGISSLGSFECSCSIRHSEWRKIRKRRSFKDLSQLVTAWHLKFDTGIFVPALNNVKEIHIGSRTRKLPMPLIRGFCHDLTTNGTNLSKIAIDCPIVATTLVSHFDLRRFEKLRSLSLVVNMTQSNANSILNKLGQLNLTDLKLLATTNAPLQDLSFKQPESLTSFSIGIDWSSRSILQFFDQLRSVTWLELGAQRLRAEEVKEILEHKVCRDLKSLELQLRLDQDLQEAQEIQTIAWWQQIQLNLLEELRLTNVQDNLKSGLLDHLPNLTKISPVTQNFRELMWIRSSPPVIG